MRAHLVYSTRRMQGTGPKARRRRRTEGREVPVVDDSAAVC